MAVLGKRKAPEPTVSTEDAQEIFRRHFEAQFLPLPEAKRKAQAVEEDDGSEDDSDGSGSEGGEWDGLSNEDDDEEDDIEEDDDDDEEEEEEDGRTSNAFAAIVLPPSRPNLLPKTSRPTLILEVVLRPPRRRPSLLAQDLELRRLIAESHLLQTNKPLSLAAALSTTSSPNAQPKAFSAGRIRQKALDMRIQALGSKTSILKQEKMPMHMRKGINAAVVEREAKRRREAKESGVILERETGKKKRRDRKSGGGGGGFGPAVGRLKGAELRISERDVKKIEGTRDTFGRRGGGKR
ncbi:hypothetical protein TrVFT333_005451 [Trichoderma virens FT-333]|nr:hypothetical protein TrVFT333_005451 [Trichoderma virens FT-333]